MYLLDLEVLIVAFSSYEKYRKKQENTEKYRNTLISPTNLPYNIYSSSTKRRRSTDAVPKQGGVGFLYKLRILPAVYFSCVRDLCSK